MTVVYQKHEFIVYRYCSGFIIRNMNKPFCDGHTHVEELEMCRVIIDNVVKSRVPKTTNTYLLISHAKLTTDEAYRKLLLDIHDTIIDEKLVKFDKKKLRYHTPHKL